MYSQHIPNHEEMARKPILSIWRKINEREEMERDVSVTDDSSDEPDDSSPASYIH